MLKSRSHSAINKRSISKLVTTTKSVTTKDNLDMAYSYIEHNIISQIDSDVYQRVSYSNINFKK